MFRIQNQWTNELSVVYIIAVPDAQPETDTWVDWNFKLRAFVVRDSLELMYVKWCRINPQLLSQLSQVNQ
jgi:hypothetical protein